MARKKKHEDHVNAEAWAIPYGDLITLLLAFFVVMYSMSSVNEGKYRILSDSLVAAFRGAPTTTAPISIGEASKGKGGDAQLSGVSPTALMKLRDPRPVAEAEQDAKAKGGSGGAPRGRDPRGALFQMADEVRAALQGLIDRDLVRVRQNALTLEIEIKADILFPSGVAAVATGALPVIEKVAGILMPFPNAVRVEGHTDDRPIATAVFPSNWELSSARAANVVQAFTRAGVDPKRMEVLGLGDNRPVAPNDTEAGRNANRRVVIVVLQTPDGAVTPGSAPSRPAPVVPDDLLRVPTAALPAAPAAAPAARSATPPAVASGPAPAAMPDAAPPRPGSTLVRTPLAAPAP